MFVSPPPITNVESISQSTIYSLGSGSFGRNRNDVNIQQQTTLDVSYIETTVANNEGIDHTSPQDISYVFGAEDLLYRSSSDSAGYNRALLKAKVIRSLPQRSKYVPMYGHLIPP